MALVFSALAGVLGIAVVAWYGMSGSENSTMSDPGDEADSRPNDGRSVMAAQRDLEFSGPLQHPVSGEDVNALGQSQEKRRGT